MNPDRYKHLAPAVIRIGIALVFLWFGTQELTNPTDWTSYIPEAAVKLTHLSVYTLTYINGAFEALAGLLLLIGLWTRVVAALLFLHLLTILSVVGYNSIGVRDFGLAIGALSVAIFGHDTITLDHKRKVAAPPQAQ
jgi:uncharacterized membrane protein YphA (DoxX/SURF4 family)